MKRFGFVALLATVVIVAFMVTGCRAELPTISNPQNEPFEQQVLELTNSERVAHGLAPLQWHNRVATAARSHSADMAINKVFSHTGSDNSSVRDRLNRHKVENLRTWGENIAAGQRTPETVVQAWMDSPGHRANILNASYTHIGIGVYELEKSQYQIYWTQKFAAFHGD